MKNKTIKYLLDKKEICYLDYHFAKFATGLSGKEDTEILLAAALVSSKTREGHICINLEDYADKCLIENDELTRCPALDVWLDKLKNCCIVGKPVSGEYISEVNPLILDEKNRLYLYRYWLYERRIAEYIKAFANESYSGNGIEEMAKRLDALFPSKSNSDNEKKSADLQKWAAYTAKMKKLTIISGGPGTGKTTTVAKLLAMIIEQGLSVRSAECGVQDNLDGGTEIMIRLAAPTGKAAARLRESIKAFKKNVKSDRLDISDEVLERIPEEASTIHRLLGTIANSPYFKHNKKNQLKLDVLVVDEASMIDVPLMAKLLEALPENAKLIILGDKDQLSSVEAGKFMGDVCASALESNYSAGFYKAFESITGFPPEGSPASLDGHSLRECFVHLKKSYRFDNKSGIGELSRLINAGKSKDAAKLLCDEKFSDISMKIITSEDQLEKELRLIIPKHYKNYFAAVKKYGKYPDENNLKHIFDLFDKFRVLCAMREGPFGINKINMLIETILIETILKEQHMTASKKDWYRGMPIMVTQNSYGVNLFNGDIGIVLPDNESDGKLKAFFPSAEGKYRSFHQLRLPEYEKVFAMTVHKSQGSEFNNVVLVLPDKQNAVLTRELLYTGITRAKEKVEIWSSEKVFEDTIEANIKRSSGLYDALRV